MKNVVRFAAGAVALCWIFAFASCAQPTNKDSRGNSLFFQGNNGGNGGGSQQGNGNNSGGNGSPQPQDEGKPKPNAPKAYYTVYLQNNSDYAVTFWYVESANGEKEHYSSSMRVKSGARGAIQGSPGRMAYRGTAELQNGKVRYIAPFYLDDDFVITIH